MSLPNTHFGAEKIAEIMNGKKNLFFAGIGGVSMCSLASIAQLRGHTVSGYDRTETDITKNLESLGITVYYKESADHVIGCDALIYTVAMPQDNPEYATAMKLGIPCISRADFLGYIMSGYESRIGVCGVHGKSTTTAMLEKIFHFAGKNPTVSCGAVMNNAGSTHRVGNDDLFIFEACEYMDSFLDFYPTVAIVLNVELDHVDYFKSLDQMENSFANFMKKTEPDGYALVNCDDENTLDAAAKFGGKVVTFGVGVKDADFCADNVTYDKGYASFDLIRSGEFLCRVKMNVPGEHAVCDALAASAAAILHGIDPEVAANALGEFTGLERRMQKCGKSSGGADVFSDYAHHPTEIRTTLETVSQIGYSRVYCVFQSHTYSRTHEFFDDFVNALCTGNIDEVIIADIYPARETNVYGVSPAKMAEEISKSGRNSLYIDSFDGIAKYVSEKATDGDMILIMGAGDINNVVKKIVK